MDADKPMTSQKEKAPIKKRHNLWITALIILLAAAAGVLFWHREILLIHPATAKRAMEAMPQAVCAVHVIDVGQGAGILVRTPTAAVLIDAGERARGDEVVGYLKALGVDRLDVVIASHHHTDHIGGLIEVLSRVETSYLLMPDVPDGMQPTNGTYFRFLDAAEKSGALVQIATQPMQVVMGDEVVLTVLGPFMPEPQSLNDTTLVVRVDAGKTGFLFMGDAESAAETALLQSKQPIDADILVAGHHGGSTSSIQDFLDAVNPKTVVIPVGADNPYGHPHREALSRLQSAAPVLRTDLDETVVCLTDGYTIKVSTHRNDTVLESDDAGRAA